MFDKNILGKRIKEIRMSKHLTLHALGEAIGSGKSVLSNIENGKKGVSVEVLCAIADNLDVSADYLLGRSDDPHHQKNCNPVP